ncbi:ribosomal protein L30 [Ephemerocybe angulata]|uniref:Large ribosomal subunit protein uL30m n=1 Tax=Ephemerocybe angulata TaxID=980116 RepID=A0A8H6M6N2_9AGAR|nr:ribosomal protein L30 [Tulosesus angulatus]
MSSLLKSRSSTLLLSSRTWIQRSSARCMATSTTQEQPEASSSIQAAPATSENAPNTHFKVTLRRSGISMGDKVKGTLLALGLHRRFQTVYHRHTPEAAGMILKVKELLEVENVPAHMVRTAEEQNRERKAVRGYQVVGNRRNSFMNV